MLRTTSNSKGNDILVLAIVRIRGEGRSPLPRSTVEGATLTLESED